MSRVGILSQEGVTKETSLLAASYKSPKQLSSPWEEHSHTRARWLTYGLFNRHKRLQETQPENHLVQLDLIGLFQTENDDVDGRGIICSKIVITAEVYRISREFPHTEVTNSYRQNADYYLKRHRQVPITILLSTLGTTKGKSDVHSIDLFIFASLETHASHLSPQGCLLTRKQSGQNADLGFPINKPTQRMDVIIFHILT